MGAFLCILSHFWELVHFRIFTMFMITFTNNSHQNYTGAFQLECSEDFWAFSHNHFAIILCKVGISISHFIPKSFT